MPGARYTIVDADANSLSRNRVGTELIHGDAQTIDYGDRVFDAVVAWNVLEHLDRPQDALASAVRNLRDGGYVILAGPVLRSPKALITRWTPHIFHVWVYKHLLGVKEAGQPGYAPFPVSHAKDANLEELVALLTARDCKPLFVKTRDVGQVVRLRESWPWLYRAYKGFGKVLNVVSFGRIAEEGDFVLIAQKAKNGEAPVESFAISV